MIDDVSRRLVAGEFIHSFQRAMEFGPRALGHRSILADPRDATIKDRVNQSIKHRDTFQPFAPAALASRAAAWFGGEPKICSFFVVA